MGRLFVYLAIIATVMGILILMPTSDPMEAARAPREWHPAIVPAGMGWVAGLLTGFVLSWAARLDWKAFPEYVAAVARSLRHRIWWMVWGGLCASVLLFF